MTAVGSIIIDGRVFLDRQEDFEHEQRTGWHHHGQ